MNKYYKHEIKKMQAREEDYVGLLKEAELWEQLKVDWDHKIETGRLRELENKKTQIKSASHQELKQQYPDG